MQILMEPDGNPANLDRGEDPATTLMSVVADIMSLIVHVQASAKLIEAAVRHDFGAADNYDAVDVVVLDDLTPCYAIAGDALNACNIGLDAALQSLLGTLSEARKAAWRHDAFAHKST